MSSSTSLYIEEHHLGPSRHTTLRNQVVYFRRKMRDGSLSEEKAQELESVLSLRDFSIHTGGRKKIKTYGIAAT